jgi:fumarylacetoacetate (FAA) hydrolase family protein
MIVNETPAPLALDATATLPDDGYRGSLVGRVWRPDLGGPSVVAVREVGVIDVTHAFPTVSHLTELPDPSGALAATDGEFVGTLQDLLDNTPETLRNATKPWLLAPVDLQPIKAAGVTFAVSLIERVIEERASGDPDLARTIRQEITDVIGVSVAELVPGSPEAADLKAALIERGLWSQYLEVGIGPDAEIFTKALPLSSVGTGVAAGVLTKSTWNNPEPELALMVTSTGRIVGATLANDVNLRDYEGRSALLLSKAKDNTASSALGPFVRLFDDSFSLEDVRQATIELDVVGIDGFVMSGRSPLSEISRDPEDLVRQLIGRQHQYPDGVAFLLGTLFAPIDDRDEPGQGFTHKRGDVVTISSPLLGRPTNVMMNSEECESWTFGLSAMIAHLSRWTATA